MLTVFGVGGGEKLGFRWGLLGCLVGRLAFNVRYIIFRMSTRPGGEHLLAWGLGCGTLQIIVLIT